MLAHTTAASRRRNAVVDVLERLRSLGPGVTFNGMLVFMHIAENEGVNVSELAQACRLTEATASRSARALVEPASPGALPPSAGLVEMRPDPLDGRGRLLFLTPAGRQLRDEIDQTLRQGSPPN